MPRKRRFVVASAIALVVTAAFLPGSGVGSSARVVRETQRDFRPVWPPRSTPGSERGRSVRARQRMPRWIPSWGSRLLCRPTGRPHSSARPALPAAEGRPTSSTPPAREPGHRAAFRPRP